MQVTNVSKSFPNQLTVHMVVFTILVSHCFLATAQPIKPTHEGRNDDQEQGIKLSREEIAQLKLTLKFDRIRRQCTNGTFLHGEKLSCEPCDLYCNKGKNMNSCGMECQAYYDKMEIAQLRKQLGSMEPQGESTNTTALWIAFALLFAVVLTFGILLVGQGRKWIKKQLAKLHNTLMEPITNLQERMRGRDSNDVTPAVQRPERFTNGAVPIQDQENQQRSDGGVEEALMS